MTASKVPPENCDFALPVPCREGCVYSSMAEKMHLGAVVLDHRKQAVVFSNTPARVLCRKFLIPVDYETLVGTFRPDQDATGIPLPESELRHLRVGSHTMGYVVRAAGGDMQWVFLSDRTEQLRQEAVSASSQSLENLEHVFSSLRHEIGNPLNSIKIALSVLKGNLDRFSREKLEEYLERSLQEVNRIEFLLKSLKRYSRIERVDLRPTESGAFLREFCREVAASLQDHGVALVRQVPGELGRVLVDPRALSEALWNVMSNAVEAAEGRENPEIVFSAYTIDGLVNIILQDNGVGIPPEKERYLFRPFFTTKHGKAGLGLVIAQRILAMMGGEIRVNSTHRKGTTVTLSLPEAPDEQP